MRLLQPSVFAWTRQIPGRCQVCGRWPGKPVCDTCLERHAAPRPRCRACAIATRGDHPLCGACITQTSPAALARCLASIDYAYPWDRLIARWKFQGDTGWSATWAELMWRDTDLQGLWRECSCVVPVPIGPAGLARRGYNQAWELAKALQRQAIANAGPANRLLATALVRTRETPEQHRLGRTQRLHNLKGAVVVHPRERPRLSGQHVLLVDDVSTTGATLEAAALALLEGGAAEVSACVLARTPPPG